MGVRVLVDTAIERLRSFAPPEGYYLAFSGGKDSVALLEIAKLACVKFDAHYSVTTVDPPELVRYIRDRHPEVIFDPPKTNMWKLIEGHGFPPTRRARYCCQELKERGGVGRTVLTGIRWAESPRRTKRSMVEQCSTGGKFFLHPIIDWYTEDVWSFIKLTRVSYCSLYDEGWKRLGCVMCPMQYWKSRRRDAERWPRYYQLYLRAFAKMLEQAARQGKARTWNNAQEVMEWYLSPSR